MMVLSESEKVQLYKKITAQLTALIGDDRRMPWNAAMTSLIALLKNDLPYVSWAGLYLEYPTGSGTLWVGPYQGKVACIEIPKGRGVCGKSFETPEPLIVSDVHQFPGHIACDELSRSEIVLPLYKTGQLIGVLDLDSHHVGAFDTIDEKYLQKLLLVLDQLNPEGDE